MAVLVCSTRADVYNDTTNDLFTTGAPQFDISSVVVTNNPSKVTFTIYLMGNPTSITWDNYAIAVITGPGGATNGNGSGAAISLTKGINYWVTCLGSGTPQLWHYNTNTWLWNNVGGATFASSTNSISLTVPYSSLGLTAGASFQFDAYTFSGTGGAMDDLANPGWASSWWNVPYASSLVETYPSGMAATTVPVIRGGLTTNDAPRLQVSGVGGGLSVYATGTVTGAQYIWESTSSLATTSWRPISTNLGNGGPTTASIPVNPGTTDCLTRCKVQGFSLTVHTIGDSTVQIWPSWNYPKTGWGQVINYFFNSNYVAIDDAAVGGTSAKSFYDSYWTAAKNNVKPGDFVFIQFGINDSNTNAAIHTDPETSFKGYLSNYVYETQALGAYPVLITPMRADLGSAGTPYGNYALAVRELAVALGVPLVDLDVACGGLIYSVGTNYATQFLYMNFPAGVYSNYPTGSSDTTHFQGMGAIAMARLVVQGIQNLGLDTNVCKLIPSLKPTCKVNFSSGGASGMVTLSDYFPEGISVTAQAVTNSGFRFTGWSGDLISTNAIASFIVGNTPMNITASFSPQ